MRTRVIYHMILIVKGVFAGLRDEDVISGAFSAGISPIASRDPSASSAPSNWKNRQLKQRAQSLIQSGTGTYLGTNAHEKTETKTAVMSNTLWAGGYTRMSARSENDVLLLTPNAAIGKNTQMSSVQSGFEGSRATDGKTETNWNSGTCTHTNYQYQPWWRVDLRRSVLVKGVTVWSRTDCCGYRLDGFEVRVGNAETWEKNNRCGKSFRMRDGDISRYVDCNGENGRYIYVVNPTKTEYFTLCEVQVHEAEISKFSYPVGEIGTVEFGLPPAKATTNSLKPPPPPPTVTAIVTPVPTNSGMVSWFKSSEVTGGRAWVSSVGSFSATFSGSDGKQMSAGTRSDVSFKYIEGTIGTKIDFGNILPTSNSWTICSLTRYTGGSQGRILNAGWNWLHGHWNGNVGVAHYDGWRTPHWNHLPVVSATDWLVFCGQNGGSNIMVGNRKNIRYSGGGGGGGNIYINQGGCCGGETSDFGIAELITWNRALGYDEIFTASEYLMALKDGTPPMPPSCGMVSWFRSANIPVNTADKWVSSVGAFDVSLQNLYNSGAITLSNSRVANAGSSFKHIRGNTRAGINFGNILPADYWTICSLTRYTGGQRGRILNAGWNWLHGHWNGNAGVAHYDQWRTPHWNVGQVDNMGGTDNWLVMCGQNGGDGTMIANRFTNYQWGNRGTGGPIVYINQGGCCGGETSDYAIAELITWNRALNFDEIYAAQEYLMTLLKDGALDGSLIGKREGAPCGMYSWFQSASLSSGTSWRSSVGTRSATVWGNAQVISASGNGAAVALTYLAGTPSDRVTFAGALPPNGHWTICSLTRYTGERARGRILNANWNWLHGHWAGNAGVAHYEGWRTPHWSQVNDATEWVAMCGQNGAPYLSLVNRKAIPVMHTTGSTSYGGDIWINQGGCCGGETSNFAVAEVMTWDRALSQSEIYEAHDYIMTLKDGMTCTWASWGVDNTPASSTIPSSASGMYIFPDAKFKCIALGISVCRGVYCENPERCFVKASGNDLVRPTASCFLTPPTQSYEVTVQFKNKYKDPVVITHISGNGPDPVLMRIKQLNSTSMTVFLQEPANEDAWHRQETGSYIVMETGVHTLPGGAVIEAGKYRARDAMWDTVTLSGVQNHGIPAYFSQVQTYNDPGFVVTRIKSLGSTSFQTQMIADEKRSASAVRHLPETMGWIALPFGQGTWPNFFEVD